MKWNARNRGKLIKLKVATLKLLNLQHGCSREKREMQITKIWKEKGYALSAKNKAKKKKKSNKQELCVFP